MSHDDPEMTYVVSGIVRQVAEFWVAMPRKGPVVSDFAMDGEHLGLIVLSITVRANDQWMCHRHALKFATAIASAARVSLKLLDDPEPARLPPHDFRGSRAILGAKHRVASDGAN